MRQIVAVVSLTLDGVMQAPGRKDEDTRGGFEHGGWAGPYFDPVMMKTMGEGMAPGGPMLFGRRTYEDFYASRTLQEPLPWQNSTLLPGEAAQRVARLKEQPGKDIVVLGSGDLLQTLMRSGLVDHFLLSIHPLVLGRGRRLFHDDDARRAYRLVRSVPTTTGVVIAGYEPA